MTKITMRRMVASFIIGIFPLICSAAHADGARIISGLLEAERTEISSCAAGAPALRGTLERLSGVSLPVSGKLILINIASQQLVAYQDGEPVLEMRVVVGAPRTKTPDLQTEIAFVRFNPTWTIPASILREAKWVKRRRDPNFLRRNDFKAYGADGRLLSASAIGAGQAVRLVQQPGPFNALGLVKLGLRNAGAIYLHDTNEPEKFARDKRTLSHGCVRLEDPFALAGWVLDTGADEAKRMQEDGDRRDIRDFERVPVVIGYFTAWPDRAGSVRYYPDIYSRDRALPSCR